MNTYCDSKAFVALSQLSPARLLPYQDDKTAGGVTQDIFDIKGGTKNDHCSPVMLQPKQPADMEILKNFNADGKEQHIPDKVFNPVRKQSSEKGID